MALLAEEEKKFDHETAFLELHSVEWDGKPSYIIGLDKRHYPYELVYRWGRGRKHIMGSETILVSKREAQRALKAGLFNSFQLFC